MQVYEISESDGPFLIHKLKGILVIHVYYIYKEYVS